MVASSGRLLCQFDRFACDALEASTVSMNALAGSQLRQESQQGHVPVDSEGLDIAMTMAISR